MRSRVGPSSDTTTGLQTTPLTISWLSSGQSNTKTARSSPLAFLTELRLELARRKLSESGRPIAGIAAEVGYRSESAFSRAFQLRYGVRPGETRGG